MMRAGRDYGDRVVTTAAYESKRALLRPGGPAKTAAVLDVVRSDRNGDKPASSDADSKARHP